MKCHICDSSRFHGRASADFFDVTPRHGAGIATAHIIMTFTCKACGKDTMAIYSGQVTATIDVNSNPDRVLWGRLSADYKYGWRRRAEGRRLTEEQRKIPAMLAGWETADEKRSSTLSGWTDTLGAWLASPEAYECLRILEMQELTS